MSSKIKFNIKKIFTQISEWWKEFKKRRLSRKKPEIDSTKEKAIELFYALIKDKETKLNYSNNSHTRVIDSELVWLTMSSADLDNYEIQIIDETKRHAHSHDLLIPIEYGYEMADKFDEELEKRFRKIEADKRNHITTDLDILVKKVKNQNKKVDTENPGLQ